MYQNLVSSARPSLLYILDFNYYFSGWIIEIYKITFYFFRGISLHGYRTPRCLCFIDSSGFKIHASLFSLIKCCEKCINNINKLLKELFFIEMYISINLLIVTIRFDASFSPARNFKRINNFSNNQIEFIYNYLTHLHPPSVTMFITE